MGVIRGDWLVHGCLNVGGLPRDRRPALEIRDRIVDMYDGERFRLGMWPLHGFKDTLWWSEKKIPHRIGAAYFLRFDARRVRTAAHRRYVGVTIGGAPVTKAEEWEGALAEFLKDYRYQRELTVHLDGLGSQPFAQDVINEIVLWKVNRYAKLSPRALEALNSVTDTQPKSHRTAKAALATLLREPGVDLAMASTFLRFRNKAGGRRRGAPPGAEGLPRGCAFGLSTRWAGCGQDPRVNNDGPLTLLVARASYTQHEIRRGSPNARRRLGPG